MNQNEEENSLPSLEDAAPNATADVLSRTEDVLIPLSDRYYLNSDCEVQVREIMRNPEKFDFTHLKDLCIYDTLSVLISTATWNIVKSCGLESNYAGVITQCSRLIFAPLEGLGLGLGLKRSVNPSQAHESLFSRSWKQSTTLTIEEL
jgi:hypothetical protein